MKKIKSYTYIAVFLSLIIGLGCLSGRKLLKFYITHEKDYNEWTPELGTKFETDVASTFFQKFEFVNLNGAISKLLHQPSMNGIYKLKNGHVISPRTKISDKKIREYADEIIAYSDFCKSHGQSFLFVQPILKVDADDKQLPEGAEDFSNENTDVLLSYLEEAGVNVLDIRKCMKQDGMNLYDYTYITDHHWTTEGAFYAFTKITEWIDANMGVSVTPSVVDLSQYEITTYPEWHLGSYGQRVGVYYAGIDNYDLIVPKFDASFVDEEGNSTGFYDAVVNTYIFEKKDFTSRYTYDDAMRCPQGVANTSQDFKVLFVSDSYATAMVPYIKLAYSEFYFQRYEYSFTYNIAEQLDPNIVIMMPYYINEFNVDEFQTT